MKRKEWLETLKENTDQTEEKEESSNMKKDLLEFLDKKQTSCLNENKDHKWENLFEEDDSKYLESDCDSEILLHVRFLGDVKIAFVKIKSLDDGTAPKILHIFVNKPDMDFTNTKDEKPTQSFDLKEKLWKKTENENVIETNLSLKFVHFQRVNCLTIFVQKNQNEKPKTVILELKLYGQHARKITKVEEIIE